MKGFKTAKDEVDLPATIKLHRGESLDVLRSLPSGCVDAVITDPPYSSGGQFRGDRMEDTRTKYQQQGVVKEFEPFTGDNRDQRSYAYWSTLWLSECLRLTKTGGMLCVFTDWRQLPTTTDMIQAGGWVWRGIVPWDKVVARPMPGRFRSQTEYVVWGTNGARDFSTKNKPAYGDGVLRIPTTPTGEREHAAQKPVKLLRMLVEVACGKNKTVLDPFMGSGTTGVACVLSGRHFVGVELTEHYFHVAEKRIKRMGRRVNR